VHAHDGEGAGAGRPRRLDEIHVAHAGGDAFGDAVICGTKTIVRETIELTMPAPSAPEIAIASNTDGKA
jgi:hypothetical protein